MNTLAWLVGRLSTLSARMMLRWAETRYGTRAARLFVYCRFDECSDEPSLIGVAGRRRGSHQTQPGDPAQALGFWQRCAGVWMGSALASRGWLVLDSWKPARPLQVETFRQARQRWRRLQFVRSRARSSSAFRTGRGRTRRQLC
jgi:hypothetical protein